MEKGFAYPSVFIDRVIIKDGKENKMSHDLLLSLKAPIESDTITTFKNDFLTIKILEVRDERLSAILQKSSELTKGMIEEPNKFVPHNFFLNLAYRAGILDQANAERFRQTFEQSTTTHEVSNDEINSKESLKRLEKEDTGESILNVYINKNLPQVKRSSHITYFVYSSYNKDKMREQVPSITNEDLEKNTKITAEVIFNKGKIASETFVYFKRDDSVWLGEVHNENGTWYTGKFSERSNLGIDGTPARQPLRRRSYYNTKIQDLRIFKSLVASQNYYGDAIKKIEEFELIDNSYLLKPSDSPLQYKNRTITCALEDLLRKNSVAYSNVTSMDIDLQEWAKTISVKVYRKRVREDYSDASSSPKADFLPDFSKNEKRIYLSENEITKNYSPSFLTIKIKDRNLPNVGNYCYGVELTFTDPVIVMLKQEVSLAEEQEAKLLEYYEKCKLLDYKRSDGVLVKGNYDPLLNKFTDQFNVSANQKMIKDITARFYLLLRRKTNSFSQNQILELMMCIHPLSGTPDGVVTFLQIYRTFLGLLRKVVATSNSKAIHLEEKYFNNKTDKVAGIRSSISSIKNKSPSGSRKYLELDITQQHVEKLSELCSLTIRKIGDAQTSEQSPTNVTPPGIADRSRMPAGSMRRPEIADLDRGLGNLLGGVTTRKPDLSGITPRADIFGDRTIIGTKVIVGDPATTPAIDYNKTIKSLPAVAAYNPEADGSTLGADKSPSVATRGLGENVSSPAVRGIIDPESGNVRGAYSTRTKIANNGLVANPAEVKEQKATIVNTGNTKIITFPDPEGNDLNFIPQREPEQEKPAKRIPSKNIIKKPNLEDVQKGLEATPKGASSKMVSNSSMEEVVREQVNKKHAIKKKKIGR